MDDPLKQYTRYLVDVWTPALTFRQTLEGGPWDLRPDEYYRVYQEFMRQIFDALTTDTAQSLTQAQSRWTMVHLQDIDALAPHYAVLQEIYMALAFAVMPMINYIINRDYVYGDYILEGCTWHMVNVIFIPHYAGESDVRV